MAAPETSSLWRTRSSRGPGPIFASADELWDACAEYFTWVEANPLQEAKAFSYQGVVTVEMLPRMRAMTIGGLCLFLDISPTTWGEYRKRDGFGEVTARVDDIIRAQKFEGAAAGLLNANIIARELGLADRQEHTGKDGEAIELRNVTNRDRARAALHVLARAKSEQVKPEQTRSEQSSEEGGS